MEVPSKSEQGWMWIGSVGWTILFQKMEERGWVGVCKSSFSKVDV